MQFSNSQLQFLTEKIMVAQKFNLAHKFYKNGNFQTHILYFGRKFFNHKKIFPTVKI